ncbi:hypothetical protein PRK78_007392 [Emydomyces testavorans]|uniref:Uncharacterized protein n=1 Tax=Emydomyces testavorans TaxID=2070801 RepID=A0AAF0DP65_9EURO|nr:hypothetical protein PRK78_007392 [Emydomyces testavorans]
MTSRTHFSRIPSASSSSASTTIADNTHPIPQPAIPTAAPSTIRRNLFHAHLNRRQHTSSTSGTSRNRTQTHSFSGSGDGTALSGPLGGGMAKSRLMTGVLSGVGSGGGSIPDGSDIVVRDKNGSYKVDIPVLLPEALGKDADDEGGGGPMEGVEGGGATGVDHEGDISGADKESAYDLSLKFRDRSEHRGNDAAQSKQTDEQFYWYTSMDCHLDLKVFQSERQKLQEALDRIVEAR